MPCQPFVRTNCQERGRRQREHGGTASGRPRLVDVAAARGGLDRHGLAGAARAPGPQRGDTRMPCARRPPSSAIGPTAPRACSPGAARHLLGVLLDVTSPFHAELVRALDTASADRGLDLVLGTHDARTDEHRAAETLLDFRCEALVLLGPQMTDAELAALAAQCPTVVVGRAGTAGCDGGARGRRPRARGGGRPPRALGPPAHRLRRRAARRIAGAPRRATATRWRGTACAPSADVVRGGADRGRRGRGSGEAARRGPGRPAHGRHRLQRPLRDRAARPAAPRGLGACPGTCPSSATTTAPWPGSAPSTSPR